MRAKWTIILLFAAIMMMMAMVPMSPGRPRHQHGAKNDSIDSITNHYDRQSRPDSLLARDSILGTDSLYNDIIFLDDSISVSDYGDAPDTLEMDSLQLAIYHHNKAVDDSIRLDSLNRAKSTGIDAPVNFTAEDSLVYYASTKDAFLYGKSNVDYEEMNLKSERVHMNMDQNLVHATGVRDTSDVGGLEGTPVFKMGSDEYESDTIMYNFKTKKGYINNVYTEQQDGF
ncbi:MAG: hypothetical protein J5682_02140, partial [Prevotella sp.]|nr:hypothetical protein [Prevotella sp.]